MISTSFNRLEYPLFISESAPVVRKSVNNDYTSKAGSEKRQENRDFSPLKFGHGCCVQSGDSFGGLMKNSNFSACLAATVFFGLLAAAPASAAPITLQSSTATTGNQAYSGVAVQFLVNKPITVSSLGLYDSDGNGFVANRDHALTAVLMTSGGAIQASANFFDASPGILDGLYRFKSIGPLTLSPGQYILAGYAWANSDVLFNCNFTGLTDCSTFNDGGGLLTYLNSPYGGGNDPSGTVPTNIWPGPPTNFFSAANMQYEAAATRTAVPEPLTLSLFGAGFVGIVAARRRAKKARS